MAVDIPRDTMEVQEAKVHFLPILHLWRRYLLPCKDKIPVEVLQVIYGNEDHDQEYIHFYFPGSYFSFQSILLVGHIQGIRILNHTKTSVIQVGGQNIKLVASKI